MCIVLLVGASGAGKSTFARRNFLPFEVISSDLCRAWISNDENDQSVTAEAYILLQCVVRARLAHGKTCVIDATNIKSQDRRCYAEFAAAAGIPAVAIFLDIEDEVCLSRRRTRTDRTIPEEVVITQLAEVRASISELPADGFRTIYRLCGAGAIESARVVRSHRG